MDTTPATSTPHALFARAAQFPDAPAYHTKVGDSWKGYTWAEFAGLVRSAAKGLIALGFEPLAKTCILSNTRLEWVAADVGAMAAGGVPSGIYHTCSAKEVSYIVNHSESTVIFVEDRAQFAKVEAEKEHLPLLKHVIIFNGETAESPLAMSWGDFLGKGAGVADDEVEKRLNALEPTQCASMIYTSGTTGPPKAVMLSHSNLSWTASTASQVFQAQAGDCCVAFLPLSHIAEQMFTIHIPPVSGHQVYFNESLEKLVPTLKEIQPTLLFSPPRIYEKLNLALASKLPPGAKPDQLPVEVKKSLIEAVGLSRARWAVVGAAPISPDVLRFFAGLGLTIWEVYGQSEDSGPTSCNVPGKVKLGSAGPPFPGVEVAIAEDGEVLVRGPNVFLGYYKDQAATEATLKDGWLYSGDLGRIDEEGFLHITGRKKDIIITAGGKNITPANIEHAIKAHPLIGEAIVIGDRRPYLVALVTLDADVAAVKAKEKGVTPAEFAADAGVRALIEAHIETVNADLAQVETVKRFSVLPHPFALERGEVTPTMKLKRNVIHSNYAAEIDAIYAQPFTRADA